MLRCTQNCPVSPSSNGFARTVVKLGVRGAAGYRIKEDEPLRVTLELLFLGIIYRSHNQAVSLILSDGAAPRRDTPADELDRFRGRALCLLSAAGLCSLPQLSLPLGEMERCPLGLSLIAASGRDVDLLALAAELLPRTPLD